MTAAITERVADLPAGLDALMAEAEKAGHGFVRRLVEDWAAGRNRFDQPGEALFATRAGGQLVGVCGLNVDPYTPAPRVGRVRHLYVATAHRRHGVGQQLVERIVEAARGPFDTLRLRTGNAAAARLYEKLGFHRCPGVPDCSHLLELR